MIKKKVVLAGDIGGTKSNIGLFTTEADALVLLETEKFTNSSWPSLDDIIEKFLYDKDLPAKGIAAASFGIAGPIKDGSCRLTNLDWTIDESSIAQRFDIDEVHLMNDLVSTGWGVGILPKDEFEVLNAGAARQGNAALIAAGTGLGEAILFWDGSAHVPTSSEGGHCDFAPRNGLEIELLEYLIEKYGHVSYERVLSGMGLVNIYDFLRQKRGGKVSIELGKELESSAEAGPVISNEAINGTDPVCKEALDMFVSIYGAEAGNLCLKCMALNGVYIGGGIAPNILEPLRKGTFMQAFAGKGRFKGLLAEVPVYVVLNELTGLLGAARKAAGLASGKAPARISEKKQ